MENDSARRCHQELVKYTVQTPLNDIQYHYIMHEEKELSSNLWTVNSFRAHQATILRPCRCQATVQHRDAGCTTRRLYEIPRRSLIELEIESQILCSVDFAYGNAKFCNEILSQHGARARGMSRIHYRLQGTCK